jgi:small conductance mechanosensitive channel
VALLSVFSLGITLAAEDIIANLAGGLVLFTSRPFDLGDVVEADGVTGTVQEIRLYHTKLLTPDGLTVMLPNKALSGSKMINYTALGRRRVSVAITASYDAPTEAVKAACWDAINATENVLQDPAPAVVLTNYGSSSIEYTILCWTESGNFLGVKNGINEKLRETFAAHNVEMTYDHLNVHVVK